MKIFYLLPILIFLISCRKKIDDHTEELFQCENISDVPAEIIVDDFTGDHRFVVSPRGGFIFQKQTEMIFYNDKLEKAGVYAPVPGEIVFSGTDGSFVTENYDELTEERPGFVISAWKQSGYMNCKPVYTYGNTDSLEYYNKGQVHYSYYSSPASLDFSAALPGANSSTSSSFKDGKDIVIASFWNKGSIPELARDSGGAFVDTVHYGFDKCILRVEKYTASGKLIWKKEAKGLRGEVFPDHRWNFVRSDNYYWWVHSNQLVQIDRNGNVRYRGAVYPAGCTQSIDEITASGNKVYASATFVTNGTSSLKTYYFNEEEPATVHYLPVTIHKIRAVNERVYGLAGTSFRAFDAFGDELWSYDLQNRELVDYGIDCADNVYLFISDGTNEIKVIKLNKSGLSP